MTIQRAYSLLKVTKAAVEDGKRIIRGIATTPSADRMGDTVLPKGAQFKLPLPLLWQHEPELPVGQVTQATVTDAGIEIVAEFAQIDEPGKLQDRLNEAWQSVKALLVRGLSIGFNPLKYSFLDTGGIEFQEWEWLELSAVTIPANSDATITALKSIDRKQLAALGRKTLPIYRSNTTPGASGKASKNKSNQRESGNMNIKEILEARRKQLSETLEKMTGIMQKAEDEGRTMDESEQQEYEQLEADFASISKHIERLEVLEKSQTQVTIRGAVPARGQSDNEGARSRAAGEVGDRHLATVKNTQKLEKGVEFARFAMCLASAKGSLSDAFAIAQARFGDNERIVNTLKSAVSAGTTTDPTWASPLVEYNVLVSEFIDYLRPQTILGQFGTTVGGVLIPDLNHIPFNVHIKGQTSGGSGYWVGQGKAKPLTKFDFEDVYLGWTKVANIAVLTEDLLRFSNPSADTLVRAALAAALIERLDRDFVDPAKAAVANVSPASLTNGVTPIHSSGNDAEAVRADIAKLWTPFINANISPTTAVYIMSPLTALKLSLMRNALGQLEFPGITINGGRLDGIPVIVSNFVPTDSTGSLVILVNAQDVFIADDGTVTIDASREASLQMDNAPTNDSPTPTATALVSMFQTNSVALRAERYINWMKRRAQAVQFLDRVNWGTSA